jgi:CDP-diglyceride synthetase
LRSKNANTGGSKRLGEPSFLAKFVVGFVFGAIVGIVFYFVYIWLLPDDWMTTPSPLPMVLFVACCAIVCGLLAGFFKRGKPRNF